MAKQNIKKSQNQGSYKSEAITQEIILNPSDIEHYEYDPKSLWNNTTEVPLSFVKLLIAELLTSKKDILTLETITQLQEVLAMPDKES